MNQPDESASLVVLLDIYHRHVLQLAAARVGGALSSDQVVRHALAALGIAHAVVDDLFVERWPIVADALTHGATLAQLGTATGGLEPDELAVGLTAWADRQIATGQLDPRRRIIIEELVTQLLV